MTESLYFPIMIATVKYSPSFFYKLTSSIKEFKTPYGVSIQAVYDASDQLSDHIFDLFKRKNYEQRTSNPDVIDEDVSLLEIVIDTEHSLKYQPLPWLEDGIKNLVRESEDSVAMYTFYLIDEGKNFHPINIAKVFTKDGIKVVDDPIEEDLSPLTDMTGFLNHLWYRHPKEPIDDFFPELTCKFFLLFG